MPDLNALVLACTLKRSPAPSSAVLLGEQVLAALDKHGATGELVRVVDHDVRFGVTTDEGDGDAWPAIRARRCSTPTSSCSPRRSGWASRRRSRKLVLERLDAELGETDDEGRTLTSGKVAVVAVVGNEDGAHHTVAECLQALNDVGFSAAPNASTYWVGEAMQGTDYNDLDETPEKTDVTTRTAAANAVHLARLLRGSPYPPAES